ncbi:hypothetical protein KF282_1421 [Lactococcus lactis subsp. lactis]|uniref:Uncharacterized protein n=1 Tax=Lactococcus lactis subsp. lactis TaxID=1360 RepID=A0A0V8CTS0_LACLL|nr:hypothetical protein KF282_1421 [Lactococcus lactis subsp. lactis]
MKVPMMLPVDKLAKAVLNTAPILPTLPILNEVNEVAMS